MKNIEIFESFLSCVHSIYLWQYSIEGNLLNTKCPYNKQFNQYFDYEHFLNIKKHVVEHRKPSIITSNLQTMWIVDSEKNEDKLISIYSLGPFFLDTFPEKNVYEEIDNLKISLNEKGQLKGLVSNIPVIAFTKILEYTIMMHYAITKDKINFSDLHIEQYDLSNNQDNEQITKHGTYEAERQMIKMVKEGDLKVIELLQKMGSMGNVGKLASDDSEPLRQIKNAILVAITLFSRAAIEGGLYPDTALSLTDIYFQAVEAAKTFQELTDITITMQKDFVNRVHKIKNSNNYSKTIQNVVQYINLHSEDDIFIKELADEFGYTDYYLSKKFKKETGYTIKEYIRNTRLENAKFLLEDQTNTVKEIADKYKFSSQSYFIEAFKDKYGMTPKQYQKNKS